MKKITRKQIVFLLLILILGLWLKSIFVKHYQIGINFTDSLPGRVYFVAKGNLNLAIGDLVVFKNDSNVLLYADKNLIKIVAGKQNDKITVQDRTYLINGYNVTAKKYSTSGARLNQFQPSDNIIPKDNYFVITTSKDSYDSRYFGFISKSQIIGKAWQIF